MAGKGGGKKGCRLIGQFGFFINTKQYHLRGICGLYRT
jgi:hypothetical protein